MWEALVGTGTRFSDEERARIAELAAMRLPGRLIAKEVGPQPSGGVVLRLSPSANGRGRVI
jgi:hypothetical protein